MADRIPNKSFSSILNARHKSIITTRHSLGQYPCSIIIKVYVQFPHRSSFIYGTTFLT